MAGMADMADRSVRHIPEGAPEIDPMLEAVLLQALDVAREKLDAKEQLVPFTALAVGETLFIETHPADDSDACFRMARHTVQNARGALAYAFCYDGYVETDDGQLDAIIAEGGMPGDPAGHAVGFLYTVEGEGEELEFRTEDQPSYIGEAPNFMEFTLAVEEADAGEDLDELVDMGVDGSEPTEGDGSDVRGQGNGTNNNGSDSSGGSGTNSDTNNGGPNNNSDSIEADASEANEAND